VASLLSVFSLVFHLRIVASDASLCKRNI
jgi:hypothetical protein